MAEEIKIKKGTATVGLIFNGGVVLAADRRTSMGYTITNERSPKVMKIANNIGMTTAGGAGDLMSITRYLRTQAKLFEIERESPMTVRSAITLLSNVLNANRMYPYYVYLIIGGISKSPELYSFDAVGGYDQCKFASSGSGSELALSVLDLGYKDNLTELDAVNLAVRAIEAAKKRNMGVGGKGVTVAVITKEGYKELNDVEVEKSQKTVTLYQE